MEKLTLVAGFRQKEVEVQGVRYTLQKIPLKSFLELEDRCTSKNGVMLKAMYLSELFKHCVVKPKVTLSDFDDNYAASGELAAEIESFLSSKADKNANPEEGQG